MYAISAMIQCSHGNGNKMVKGRGNNNKNNIYSTTFCANCAERKISHKKLCATHTVMHIIEYFMSQCNTICRVRLTTLLRPAIYRHQRSQTSFILHYSLLCLFIFIKKSIAYKLFSSEALHFDIN